MKAYVEIFNSDTSVSGGWLIAHWAQVTVVEKHNWYLTNIDWFLPRASFWGRISYVEKMSFYRKRWFLIENKYA